MALINGPKVDREYEAAQEFFLTYLKTQARFFVSDRHFQLYFSTVNYREDGESEWEARAMQRAVIDREAYT